MKQYIKPILTGVVILIVLGLSYPIGWGLQVLGVNLIDGEAGKWAQGAAAMLAVILLTVAALTVGLGAYHFVGMCYGEGTKKPLPEPVQPTPMYAPPKARRGRPPRVEATPSPGGTVITFGDKSGVGIKQG